MPRPFSFQKKNSKNECLQVNKKAGGIELGGLWKNCRRIAEKMQKIDIRSVHVFVREGLTKFSPPLGFFSSFILQHWCNFWIFIHWIKIDQISRKTPINWATRRVRWKEKHWLDKEFWGLHSRMQDISLGLVSHPIHSWKNVLLWNL